MDSFSEMWDLVKEYLRSNVTQAGYNVWLEPLEFNSFDNNTVTLDITEFKKKIVSTTYYPILNEAFEAVLGFPVEIKFHVTDAPEEEEEPKKKISPGPYDYTFDNFIIGSSNRFAHAACYNVAKNPGKEYNPLFIYGHSGLGKTHLLSAIMNDIKLNYPDLSIIYTSGELFTNEFIYYLKNHNTHSFQEKYRNTDVLLVDDIQFIAKTESTQEEFFHTFNVLIEGKKQIVLTSDRPPKEMVTLEERLRTRFEWGLIADVQPPALETRIAILKSKCDELQLDLSDDIITFVAENIKRNIRQLEGAVKKIQAIKSIRQQEPDIAVAKEAISDIINDNQPTTVTVDNIIKEVARTFNVTPQDIRSEKRSANISQARQAAIYVVNEVTTLSYKAIGEEFGNKHYSTIIYALKEINTRFETNANLKAMVNDVIKNIREN